MNEDPKIASLGAFRKRMESLRIQVDERQTLSFGGGGGTFDGMDVVDAKIAAAEARTDTKFAELKGDLQLISTQTAGLKLTIVLTGIAVLGLTLAALGWGATIFGDGMSAATIADQAAAKVAAENEARWAAFEKRADDQSADIKGIADLLERWQKLQPPSEK